MDSGSLLVAAAAHDMKWKTYFSVSGNHAKLNNNTFQMPTISEMTVTETALTRL